MCTYVVNYKDPETGAVSPLDVIRERKDYTADDYIRDCMNNAEDDYYKMLLEGEVTLDEMHD